MVVSGNKDVDGGTANGTTQENWLVRVKDAD
jgi:hypothetical protein